MVRRLLLVAPLLLLMCALISCSKGQKRPYGFLRIGKIADLRQPEVYLPEARLLVRHDSRGFSVMSTQCTFDLSPLVRKDVDGHKVWESTLTTSRYDDSGKVLRGPAEVDLPYYSIAADAAVRGGPVDSLYARIGVEKDLSWRFVPEDPPAGGQ